MTTCKFSLKENVLTTISGADSGSYAIKDNHANILIDETESQIYPFDFSKAKFDNNKITIEV